jgi:sugar lactone lactonase YvrE
MTRRPAETVREYGPFPASHVGGVTFDGRDVWFAAGDRVQAFSPETGELTRIIAVPANAGTAFDGRHLYQLNGRTIQKIDHASGQVVATFTVPGEGMCSGLAWAEGMLWAGQHRERTVVQIDPETGAVLRTLTTSRFVTGVTWVEGELWHGATGPEAGAADAPPSELRRIDPSSGEVLEVLEMPHGFEVSGLEGDGRDLFYVGGGKAGTVRAVRRPKRR